MTDANTRGRDRVPIEVTGQGITADSGERFSFAARDFSVMGMFLRVQGAALRDGQRVTLQFQLPGDMEHFEGFDETGGGGGGGAGAGNFEDAESQEQAANITTVTVRGEIVRATPDNGGINCGVKWMEDENSESLGVLEAFYTDRFFDMMD